MSAAARIPNAAKHALNSISRVVNDATKTPLPKQALTAPSPRPKDASAKPPESLASLPSINYAPRKDFERKETSKREVRLLNFLYDPYPQPINYTTFASTKAILEDPSHPFHIRTVRRFEAFDANKLHWRVHVPIDVSKKAAIRNWAKKKVKRAFVRVLEERGYEKDGLVMEEVDGGGGVGVRGALLMILNKDPKVALGVGEEVIEREVRDVLTKVLERQEQGLRRGPLAHAHQRQRR